MSSDKVDGNLFVKAWHYLKKNWTSTGMIIFIILGFIIGHVIKNLVYNGRPVDGITLKYLSIPPMIVTRCLLLLIVPFLIASLSTSLLIEEEDEEETKNEDQREQRQITRKIKTSSNRLVLITLAFFLFFLLTVTIVGISLVLIFGLGKSISNDSKFNTLNEQQNYSQPIINAQKRIEAQTKRLDSILNIILNIFPSNVVSTLFQTANSQTKAIWPSNRELLMDSNYQIDFKWNLTYQDTPNMLGICLISLILGVVLQSFGPSKTATIRSLLKEISHIINYLILGLMQTMPVVMFLWMLLQALKMPSKLNEIFYHLTTFFIVTFGAFVFVLGFFYPSVYFICVRKNPFSFYRKIFEPIMVAFGSCSSTMTLPFTMKAMEENVGLNKRLSRFILPLGMTIHMNGTSMYYSMMAIFIAQAKGHQLEATSIIVLGILIILISMSLPGVSSGGAMLIIIFETVLNMSDGMDILAYLLAFDWLIERFRTVTNITGDCFVAYCIESLLADEKQEDNREMIEKSEEIIMTTL